MPVRIKHLEIPMKTTKDMNFDFLITYLVHPGTAVFNLDDWLRAEAEITGTNIEAVAA